MGRVFTRAYRALASRFGLSGSGFGRCRDRMRHGFRVREPPGVRALSS